MIMEDIKVGDRVVLNTDRLYNGMNGNGHQTGTIIEKDGFGNSVLVRFDNNFAKQLHNCFDKYKERLYYWLDVRYLDLFVEKFKFEDLDKENWWED